MTPPQARCGSSGGHLICHVVCLHVYYNVVLDILYLLHNFMAEFGSSESRFDVLTPHDQHCNLLYSKSIVVRVYYNYGMNQ